MRPHNPMIGPHDGHKISNWLRRLSQLTILPRIWFFYLAGLSIAVLRRLLWTTRGTPVENTEEILYVAKNGPVPHLGNAAHLIGTINSLVTTQTARHFSFG
jgi:hypothetical protein